MGHNDVNSADDRDAHILERLYQTIVSRRGADPQSSYTARLFAKGRQKIARKVGEEAIEVVVAAITETPERLADESADVLYHLLVLWADAGVQPAEVWAKLAAREGVSGLVEKKARGDTL